MILKNFLRTKLAVKDLAVVMKWLYWLYILLKRGICRIVRELIFTFFVPGAGKMPRVLICLQWKMKMDYLTEKKGCSVQGYEPYSKNANYSYPVIIRIYQETIHRNGAKSFQFQHVRRQHFQ